MSDQLTSASSDLYQEAVRAKGHGKCPNHRLKDVVYVCLDCKTLLCNTCCIKSVHKTHNLEELDVVAQEKKTVMLDFVNNSENNTLPHLKEDLVSTDQQVATVCSEFKELSTNMKQQGEKCKQEMDKVISDVTSICDEMERSNRDLLRQQRKLKQHRYNVISAEVKECKKALQTGTDVDVFDTDFDTLRNDTDPDKAILQTCHYTPCTAITDHLKQAIGKFTAGSNDDSHTVMATTPIVDPLETFENRSTDHVHAGKSTCHTSAGELLDQSVILSQFSFSSELARSICPTPEAGQIWVLKWADRTVLLIDNKGKTKQTIEPDSRIHDMCVSPVTGHLWFCTADRTIYEFQNGETPVAQFTTNEIPFSICITIGGRVIVGTLGRLTVYTATGSVLHTSSNEEQTTLEPCKLSTCSITGNVAVVHVDGLMMNVVPYVGSNEENEEEVAHDRRMHIIVYDESLNLRFTYRGEGIQEQQSVIDDNFVKSSVVYDSFGNLVISDVETNKIELLSGTGQYLRTLYSSTEEIGVVGIGSRNILWLQMEDDEGYPMVKLKYYK